MEMGLFPSKRVAMSDPHLDSVHLEALRREEFRQARESLLNAVGQETRRAAEIKRELEASAPAHSRTLLHSLSERIPPAYEFALMDKDHVYPLKVGLNTIGRLSDNDVIIPDPYLSRRHCAILVHASERCELHDVASKNGTFLNGKKIVSATLLQSGDEIRMCDRQFIFVRRSDLPSEAEVDKTQAE